MNRSASSFLPCAGDLTRTNGFISRRRVRRRLTASLRLVRSWLPRWDTTPRDRAGLRFGAIAGTSFAAGVLFVLSLLAF